MIARLSIVLLAFFAFDACTKKQYICPAYNSYFIHDDKEQQKHFMPFHVDSLGEGSATIDNTSPDTMAVVSRGTTEVSSKYQPRNMEREGKKYQPNGIVINEKGKKRMRNVKDIEMTFINARPISQFSNVDSSSLKKNQTAPDGTDGGLDATPASSDSL